MEEYITTTKKELDELRSYRSAYWMLYGWVSAEIERNGCPEDIKNSLICGLGRTGERIFKALDMGAEDACILLGVRE